MKNNNYILKIKYLSKINILLPSLIVAALFALSFGASAQTYYRLILKKTLWIVV